MLTEVQNQSCCNILRGHILPPCDVCLDPLEACFYHCLLQWELLPTPTPPCLPSCLQLSRHANLYWKLLRPALSWGSVPTSLLRTTTPSVSQPWKIPQHIQISPLPDQIPRQPPPNLPRLLNGAYHWRLVIITRRHRPSQILKHCHIFLIMMCFTQGHIFGETASMMSPWFS